MVRSALVILAAAFVLTQPCCDTAHADNVSAALSGGTLKLKGDGDANTVTLDQVALNPDALRVTGTGTTINGGSDPLIFEGVTGGLQVDLGGGDDTLLLDTVTLAGTVKIKMGAGADTLSISGGELQGTVSVDLGGGDNVLQLCSPVVDGTLSVKTGAGTGSARNAACGQTIASNQGGALVLDSVEVKKGVVLKGSKRSEAVTIHDSHLDAGAKLTLGGGSDAVAVCHSAIGTTLAVQMGRGAPGTTVQASCGGLVSPSGDNALDVDSCAIGSDLSARMGGSADSALFSFNLIDGAVKIDLGQGANTLTLDATASQKTLTVKSGKGDDAIQIKNAQYGASVNVKAGGGTNAVTFSAVGVVNDLSVVTGNGNDTIDTTGATVHGTIKIKHGKGTDVVTP